MTENNLKFPFKIITAFLKKAEFESFSLPRLPFTIQDASHIALSIDVQSKAAENTPCHIVELHTTVTSEIGDAAAFSLKLVYLAVVELKEMSGEDRERILQVAVPQTLFNSLRALIWNLTSLSGFTPVMIHDYDFSTERANAGTELLTASYSEDSDNKKEKLDPPEENSLPLGYDWIVRDTCSTKGGADFWESFKEIAGTDCSSYEELPQYKYFYRFLSPIEYHHPDYEECEDSFWPILFQLIFAEAEEVRIVDRAGKLPELELDYCTDNRRTVSSLTLVELEELTSFLSLQSFTQTGVDICDKILNDEYAGTLQDNRSVSKEEMLALYNCNRPNANPEDIAFVEKLYDRVKECELQTFPYKF